MPKKKKRYLVETSAVRAAIAETTPRHSRHFLEVTNDGELSTSLYIRMEFIRRWICYYLAVALKVDFFNNVRDALSFESETFSPRDLKTLVHLVSVLYGNGKDVRGTEAAKEIIHIAVTTLHKFDRRFRSQTPNSCGCKRGGKALRPDFNNIFGDVREFLRAWASEKTCGLESFLDLRKPSKASKLLKINSVSEGTSSGKYLAKFKETGQPITCKECAKIGDIVIALEQHAAWCLVHIDSAFDALCKETGRPHIRIKSVKAIEEDVPK